MTKETWEIVAKNVNRVVTSDPEGRIGLLAMGYHYLPIHLKSYFLHIGTFPKGNEVDAWTLIRLWVAEGFLKSDKLRDPEEVAEECLEDLVSRNLIMVTRKKVDGRIKSCSMHELLQHLSVREAEKEKLLNVITNNEVPNFSAANEQSAPNFSLHPSISLEKFMKSSQVVRSLYLFKEPTGKTSKFKALRVLAIPKSSFIFCHHMTLDSAILRYLEVTSDKDFTEFLGYMHNLQTFIFYTHKILKVLTFPREFWNLKQLRHLRVMHNIHLPKPQGNNSSDVDLHHLQELSNLCVASCTKEVLSRLTNLKKLRIDDFRRDIKDNKIETSWSLLNLVCLNKLESLYLCFSLQDVLTVVTPGKLLLFPNIS
ncbi:hypothetical protein H5410_010904 [Solanum commersonii]|uniref:Uncharacterized protein n=1 Tax=Solanum commersonii TaxID=4109 RepID=A0A9J6AM44_SOLCO|nr:hypothetical protein H5410_010904 [Solanum commersonii]